MSPLGKKGSWVNVLKLFDSQGSDILRHLMIRVSRKLEDTFLGDTCGHTLQIVVVRRGGGNLRILGNFKINKKNFIMETRCMRLYHGIMKQYGF